MSPKILLEKNKERENRRSEEKEKNVMAALQVFMLTSLDVFEIKRLFAGRGLFWL